MMSQKKLLIRRRKRGPRILENLFFPPAICVLFLFFYFQLFYRERWYLVGFFFNLGTADSQCCVNFCCTAKWFSYPHIHYFKILFSKKKKKNTLLNCKKKKKHSFPLWFILVQFSVLYSRTLLFQGLFSLKWTVSLKTVWKRSSLNST